LFVSSRKFVHAEVELAIYSVETGHFEVGASIILFEGEGQGDGAIQERDRGHPGHLDHQTAAKDPDLDIAGIN
jgi:hypothetical protein